MIGIGRGIALALACVFGLASGLGGILTLGLLRATPPLTPAAAVQEWEITLELTDSFLADRINAGGQDNPIALRDVRVTSRDDGTVLINATVSPTPGGVTRTPTAGRPGPPIPLPINPPSGGAGLAIPGEIVLRPGVQDGKLTVAVVRAGLGPLPTPPNLGRLLEDPLNARIAGAVQDEPFRVIAVATRQGAIIVRAMREGR